MKRIVPMPNKYMKESLILKYDERIRALILSLVTLSVFGDIARLMPTEKMTPATVYSVPSTSPGTDSKVNSEMAQEIAVENRRYAKFFFIADAKIISASAKTWRNDRFFHFKSIFVPF